MRLLHEHPFGDTENLLKTGIFVSFFIFLLELFGGVWSHSLALLSDSWHVFIDIWALVLSFLAIFLAKRPANDRRTYGLHRMEVMAALANGLTVFLIAAGILYTAVVRFKHPPQVHSRPMLIIAAIGLLANLLVAVAFYKKSANDLNMRGVFLHLISDTLSSVAVLVAGTIIAFTGWRQIDPIVSVVIGCIVLGGGYRLMRDAFNTLLEGVPRGIQAAAVEQSIQGVDGVLSVHDLHIWSICSHLKALSGHVTIDPRDMTHQDRVLDGINRSLKERFGISHTTIQVESKAWPEIEQAQI
jgi:cobalt-zinc-cadmium efflux system protein